MSNKAPALENGIAIIELVAKKKTIGFNQIKTELGINPASLTRYISTLLDKGFIKKDKNKQYVIGDRLFKILDDIDETNLLPNIVQPILENISGKLGCTAQYMSFENGRIICKAKYMHKTGLVMQDVGESRTDYILHPWGFLYLADLDDNKRRVVIKNSNVDILTRINAPSDTFLMQLIKDASKGYSDDLGQIYNGIRRIAVPVFKGQNLIGAIGIGLVGITLDTDTREDIVKVLLDKSKDIGNAI
jgi:DNA-binding IclR family transcriptional regulator